MNDLENSDARKRLLSEANLIILENNINKKFETKKKNEYGWYADPEEVKKAEMELSSTLGGDYYISRLQILVKTDLF